MNQKLILKATRGDEFAKIFQRRYDRRRKLTLFEFFFLDKLIELEN